MEIRNIQNIFPESEQCYQADHQHDGHLDNVYNVTAFLCSSQNKGHLGPRICGNNNNTAFWSVRNN